MIEIDILKGHDLLYYNEAEPLISDEEYDKLKDLAKKLYPNHPYFKTVGATVDGEKVKLPFILGSLNKIKVDTVEKWFADRREIYDEYVATLKLDGASIYVEYYDGEVIFASTRGDGYYGLDITQKAKIFCPKIYFKDTLCIRGEATILGSKLYKELGYKNRRNGAAGILNRQKNNDHVQHITPFFYEIVDAPKWVMQKNEIDKLIFLADEGLRNAMFSKITGNEKDCLISLLKVGKERAEMDGFDIDGLVIKPIKYERENVYYPENAVAFKMNEKPVQCEVTGINWQVSRMGKLKPVVEIVPTEIGGVTVSRTTGFNADFIKGKSIGKGAIIEIVRSGDVIPHIVGVWTPVRTKLPKVCPSCGAELKMIGVDLVCDSNQCNAGVEKKIAYFLRKLGAENITETTIENLGLATIEDCYCIDEFDIADIDGFGINRGEQIVKEIHNTLTTTPEKLIAALGMSGIGETVSTAIVNHLRPRNNDEIMVQVFSITPSELEDIEGIGPITAETFCMNIGFFGPLISFLYEQGLKWKEHKESPITGKIFTLTGKGPISRPNVEALISNNGGIVKSMSKKTNYLVAADRDSQSSKAKKARKYGTEVISYEDLMEMAK